MSKINLMNKTISHHLKHRFKAHIGGNMGNKPKIDTNIPSIHKSLGLSRFWANMGKIRGGNTLEKRIFGSCLIGLKRTLTSYLKRTNGSSYIYLKRINVSCYNVISGYLYPIINFKADKYILYYILKETNVSCYNI